VIESLHTILHVVVKTAHVFGA